MDWEGQAFCLSSNSIIGQSTTLQNMEVESAKISDIIVADQISLTDLVPLLEANLIKAVIVRKGSLADHAAVLLNGQGVQLAVAPNLPQIASGTPILIDGVNQKVLIGGDIDSLELRLTSQHHPPMDTNQQTSSISHGHLDYCCEQVSVHVDGKTAEELMLGLQYGAMGIGILRTDSLGWGSANCPAVATHYKLYAECIAKVHPHRPNIRLFDIGGDKIPEWARGVAESVQSPLANRGIRAIHLLTEAFKNQLSAICDLASNNQLGIVIPMVTDTNDIHLLKQLLAETARGNVLRNIRLGVMVEVPAAAISIESILPELDFVRIGPGDLTQFTLAKLRVNLEPTELSGSMVHPAVLALIENVTEKCRKVDKPVSMCLDVEPRSTLLEMLLSAGVRTFCVSPPNVPITIRRLNEICKQPGN